MRARARGFLLFSFAFSSVLASVEVLKVPAKPLNVKNVIEPNSNKSKIDIHTREIKTGVPNTQDNEHALGKRSTGVFNQADNKEEDTKKDSYDSLQDSNLGLDRGSLEKGTQNGFNRLIGKREFSADDYCSQIQRSNPEFGLHFNKRLSKSFNEMFGGKRAPMSFHGMRGKKSDEYGNEIIDPFDPKTREFLMDSGLIDDQESDYPYERSEEVLDESGYDKRSPYAFQGMRGKKDSSYDLKRAMGFLGMRGKKGTEIWNSDANYKRAPQTGFFGMKGKKAQSAGFFGMRGKKASPSAFFGIKGKREPSEYDFQDFSSQVQNQMKESESSRNRFRRGIAWLNNSKKAKNAFFGIRGKKSTQESTDFVISRSKHMHQKQWIGDSGNIHDKFAYLMAVTCGRDFKL